MGQPGETFITFQVDEGCAVLTLSRPDLNVIHIPMLQQLDAAFQTLSQDDRVRLLILRAAGKMFSAGVDVADHTPDKVGEMIPLFDRVCQALADFPTPTLAVVHGHALGGGCELVLCCDFAVMAEQAKIGQPEIKLAALAPIAALRLPNLVGYRLAADMLFTGKTLTAPEALQAGLVNAAVPLDQLEDWVAGLSRQLLGLSGAALKLLKRTLQAAYPDWKAGLPAVEGMYLDELMSTTDAHEGLAAFMEKRAPVWKHR